ncbi:hypothetical protein [Sciscionella sediminilitoris]|uniref:hypothetical protein n=1 Tax=Sciscionella sediminilitoris TaxID=1445613 RepID=UPI0012E289F3|nr:hypothetical protein [Sciscionella sp. SE31]
MYIEDRTHVNDDEAVLPTPPEGRSRVLEYYKDSKKLRWATSFWLFIGIIAFTSFGALGRGMSLDFWVRYPYIILLPLLGGAVPLMFTKHQIMTAGADWVQWGRKWVDLYDLGTINVIVAGESFALQVYDNSGRKAYLPVDQVQGNPKLWDLVYNGILYSVEHYATVKGRGCRKVLRMDPNV